MQDPRPSKESLHMLTAFLWSRRATCKQKNRNIGCVITDNTMDRVLAIAYNGPPAAMLNDACRNIKGDCGCVHAEANAIARVDSTIPNKLMFVTMIPCENCANLIAQSNIDTVFYCEDYRNKAGYRRLIACGINVLKIDITSIKKVPKGKNDV